MYYAFLGHQPQLSTLELEVMTGQKPDLLSETLVSLSDNSNLLDIADKLGGTMKIARKVASVSRDNLPAKLFDLMVAHAAKNVAISNYTDFKLTMSEIHDLKESIVRERPVRFVSFETKGHELVMLKKKHVAEFNLIPDQDGITIAETVWIYDGLEFAARDRKKPYQDIKRGMLPVKLARIMVNLATQGKEGLTLYDPFCGTGTILAEAMMVGSKVVGSDLDPQAVQGTKDNLEWLSAKFGLQNPLPIIHVSDATNPKIGSVDCIATEPLMGPLLDARHNLPEVKIKNIARGLDKLYRGALRAWLHLLPVGARVVITLPEFKLSHLTISTITIDTIRSLGYNYVLSIPYTKPGITVIRNITILEKN